MPNNDTITRIYRHGRRWFAALVYNQMTEFLPLLHTGYLPILDAEDFARKLGHQVPSGSPLRNLIRRFDAAKFLDAYREFSAPVIIQGSHMDGDKEVIPIVATDMGLESGEVTEQELRIPVGPELPVDNFLRESRSLRVARYKKNYIPRKIVIPREQHHFENAQIPMNKNGDICVTVKKIRPMFKASVLRTNRRAISRHIYDSLATFQLGDGFFEIWPLPRPHVNLNDLWAKIHAKKDDDRMEMWSVDQMTGIAEALDFIHSGEFAGVHFHGGMRPERILWSGGRLGLLPPDGILQVELLQLQSSLTTSDDDYVFQRRDIKMLCWVYLVFAACLILGWKDMQTLLTDLEDCQDEILSGTDVMIEQAQFRTWVSKLRGESSCALILRRVIASVAVAFYHNTSYFSRELVSSLRKAAGKDIEVS